MRFIIYARKSSESEDRQALSIQSQIIEMQEIARRENVQIVKIFQESKSAKAPGRPVFAEMINFIKKGKAEGILCWKIDRLARNPVDEGVVKWLLQKEIIKQIKTFERDYNPEDNVVIASIEFSMANQYIRDLSRNVKRGLAEKVRLGEYPGSRPIGYVTDSKSKKMVIDAEPASFIRRAFHLYAMENYATEGVANMLYDEGFRSRLGNKVGKSTIHRMLTNPIYAGLFFWKGQTHKGIHEPIVSLTLFDAVEKKLAPKKRLKQNQTTRVFTYRGFLVCGGCGLKVTAEVKKGHTYYRCTKSRGVRKCSQCYTREEELEKALGAELAKIHFDDDVLDLIVDASKEKLDAKKQFEEETETRLTRLLEEARKRKDSLVEKFIDNALPKEIYDRKYSELNTEEAHIEEQLKNMKDSHTGLAQEIETAVRFVKTAHDLFNRGTPETRREVVEILSSNIAIKDRKIASFSLNEPFTWLREDAEIMQAEIRAFEPKKEAVVGSVKTKAEAGASARSTVLRGSDSNRRPNG